MAKEAEFCTRCKQSAEFCITSIAQQKMANGEWSFLDKTIIWLCRPCAVTTTPQAIEAQKTLLAPIIVD